MKTGPANPARGPKQYMAPATSSNWSGAVAKDHPYSDVEANWTVRPASGTPDAYDADWIGLGGYLTSERALVQGGTESWIDGNGRHYNMWREFLPEYSQPIATVSPGDAMYTHVSWPDQGNPAIHIVDMTSGRDYSYTWPTSATIWPGTTQPKVRGTTAEWVIERPTRTDDGGVHCYFPKLSNYGSQTFTGSYASWTNSGKRSAGSLSAGSVSMVSSSGTTMSFVKSLGGPTLAMEWNSSGAKENFLCP